MTGEIAEITESYDVWPDQIYGYLQAMNAKLDELLTRQRSLDETLAKLVAAGANGGARGFRQALGQVANGRG